MLKQMAGLILRFLIFVVVLAGAGLVVLWVYWDSGPVAYYRGDYVTALKEYGPLAEGGCTDAQFLVGTMYESGEGGLSQDFTAAVKWYRRAADSGDGEAQAKLSTLYRKGQGVPQDDVEAQKWMDRSIALGFRKSTRLYPKCEKEPGS